MEAEQTASIKFFVLSLKIFALDVSHLHCIQMEYGLYTCLGWMAPHMLALYFWGMWKALNLWISLIQQAVNDLKQCHAFCCKSSGLFMMKLKSWYSMSAVLTSCFSQLSYPCFLGLPLGTNSSIHQNVYSHLQWSTSLPTLNYNIIFLTCYYEIRKQKILLVLGKKIHHAYSKLKHMNPSITAPGLVYSLHYWDLSCNMMFNQSFLHWSISFQIIRKCRWYYQISKIPSQLMF